jgi:branched-chain amino acid transport system permease protein
LYHTVLRLLKEHAELVVLMVLVLGAVLLGTLSSGKGIPVGVFGLGVVDGAIVALQAIGIVLVYRSNRLINFAQVSIGAVGGVVFFVLARLGKPLVALHAMCPSCLDTTRVKISDHTFTVPQVVNSHGQPITWMVHVNFWVSLAAALVVVLVLSYGSYSLIIKRFNNAPRLIATVVTIGLSAVFDLVRDVVPRLFHINTRLAGVVPFPFQLRFAIGRVQFNTPAAVALVLTGLTLVLLTLFFARTNIGVVLRGASENPQRAESLGVNTPALTSIVWVIAGLLSGIVAVLAATSGGVGSMAGLQTLLAVAVVGGLVSIPITVLAGVVFGLVNQALLWTLGSAELIDGLVLVIIVTVFLVQRSRGSRVDTESDAGWKAAREARPIPAELRSLDVVRRWLLILRGTGLIVILGLPFVLSPSQTNLAAVTLIYGIVALSLLVLTGWAGQISLGHFAFAAIGAWVTAVTGWPFPLSILAGSVVGAAVAVAIGLPALRLRGLHLAISTLAFAVAVTSILLNPRYLGKLLPHTLNRPRVLGLALDDQRTFYYFTLLFLVLVVVAVMGLRRSRTARALIGARDNEAAAQAFGINLVRARLGAFAVSGFLAAFAGGMFAFSQYGVNVQSFTPDASIRMFLMVVIGGLGSVAGPLLGAGYVGAVNIFGQTNPLFALGATGIGVVTLLLFAPGGLGDLAFRARDSVLRRVAARFRIDVPSLVADRMQGLGWRVAISPRTRPGSGGTLFTPRRYRPLGQWSVETRHDAAVAKTVKDTPKKEPAGV